MVDRPDEFGGVGVTEEAGAAGIGVSLCETHPVDVTRPLLATGDTTKTRRFVCVLIFTVLFQIVDMSK